MGRKHLQTVQREIPAGLIDLGFGQPDPGLLPVEFIRSSAVRRLETADPSLLQYGLEQGAEGFRGALARFLGAVYTFPVDPEGLFVTTGASTALDLICGRFARPGDTVFVEEPSYFLALRIFADRRLVVKGVPVDEQGIIPEALSSMLRVETPAFVYSIPAFHNPTGITLPTDRREQLAGLSREHGFFIVADEVYHLLHFGTPPPPAMNAFDQDDTILSVGSFSKILAPGLRLGWIQAAPHLLERFVGSGLLQSSGGLNPFTSCLVEPMIGTGLLGRHLDVLKKTYARRAEALTRALKDKAPPDVSLRDPAGGFFLWLELPGGSDVDELLPTARKQGLNFLPGRLFSTEGGLENTMRLSFSYYDEDRLMEGGERLGRFLAENLQ